jgi:hypothetical protein
MARQIPFTSGDSTGFYGGAATLPVTVNGKTQLNVGDSYQSSLGKSSDTGGGGGGGGGGSAAVVPKKKKKKKKEKAKATPYNPLYSEFKTPAELRKEAAELAALSVASEESIRAQQALQETGLTGLSTALGNRLGGLNTEYQSTLSGLGNAYGGSAANTAAATNEQLIASGAPSSVAPVGANPMLGNTIALLGAVPSQYAATAAATGAQLVGASQNTLQKTLAERANTVSANTAKYLLALRDSEVQRAISQGTLAQNEARLNLTGQSQAWDQQVDAARISQGWQRLAQSAANAGAKAGKDKAKAIKNTKAQILADIDKWTGPTVPSGKFEYTVYYTEGETLKRVPKSVFAISESDAIAQATAFVPQAFASTITADKGKAQLVAGSPAQILNKITAQLVNQGMNKANAQAWVRRFILAPAGLNVNSSGAFMGGVGGSGI